MVLVLSKRNNMFGDTMEGEGNMILKCNEIKGMSMRRWWLGMTSITKYFKFLVVMVRYS